MNNPWCRVVLVGVVVALLGACSPKVGSEAWCNKMKEKDKNQWTLEEAKDYTKFCIIP